jgi:hypothetical protein
MGEGDIPSVPKAFAAAALNGIVGEGCRRACVDLRWDKADSTIYSQRGEIFLQAGAASARREAPPRDADRVCQRGAQVRCKDGATRYTFAHKNVPAPFFLVRPSRSCPVGAARESMETAPRPPAPPRRGRLREDAVSAPRTCRHCFRYVFRESSFVRWQHCIGHGAYIHVHNKIGTWRRFGTARSLAERNKRTAVVNSGERSGHCERRGHGTLCDTWKGREEKERGRACVRGVSGRFSSGHRERAPSAASIPFGAPWRILVAAQR